MAVVNHRPFNWLIDIFLGRKICSQSRGIGFQKSIKLQIVKTSKNSISLEVFFSGKKTANETFQGYPELHFECKFQIYASKKYLVTK